LRWVDAELARLDQSRAWLVNRRIALLAELAATGSAPDPAPAAALPSYPARARAERPERPELSGRTVARLLLAAGAVLVVIAAAAFTVANWAGIGALGRSLILLAVTAIVLAVPVLLRRRGLDATAESVAAIGLAFTLADAYLLARLAHPGVTGGPLAAGLVTAGLAAIWAGYGTATRLRGPRLAAIGLAQLPVLLITVGLAPHCIAVGLVITAAADLGFARLAGQREWRPEQMTSLAAAAITWLAAVLLAGGQALLGAQLWSPVALAGAAATACWLTPSAERVRTRCAGIVTGTLAILTLPLSGWARLAVLTVAAVVLVALAARVETGLRSSPKTNPETSPKTNPETSPKTNPETSPETSPAGDRPQATRSAAIDRTSAICGAVLAAAAAAWSLGRPVMTVTEFAVLAVAFVLTAARAKRLAALCAALALAAATGLALAAPLAAGWPATRAAFAAVGVAVIALITATLIRERKPDQARVLDVGVAPVIVLAAIVAAHQPDALALVAACAAVLGGGAAWARAGKGRTVALIGTGCAVAAAIAAQSGPLRLAWAAPFRQLGQPWSGHPLLVEHTGLSFAVSVLTVSLAAGAAAAGAWRGHRRGILDAAATATAVLLAPALLASGLPYGVALGCALALTLVLTGWAATSGTLASARGAVISTTVTLAWSLAGPAPTLITLGVLAAAYPLAAWRCQRPAGRAVFEGLTVLATACFTAAAVLAADGTGWQATAAALTIAALTIAALTVAALLCLGSAGRRERGPLLWAGLVIAEAAWCAWLISWGVTVIEPYTVPAAAIALGYGWQADKRRAERDEELGSWAAYGAGLAILLLPSLIVAWAGYGWLRPALLAAGAAGVALAGARLRLQAPLLIGIAVAVLDAGHQLMPEIRQLAQALPGWVPVAVIGAALLWAGATYEARLRNLATLRRTLAALR
jgi:hypothetical protein